MILPLGHTAGLTLTASFVDGDNNQVALSVLPPTWKIVSPTATPIVTITASGFSCVVKPVSLGSVQIVCYGHTTPINPVAPFDGVVANTFDIIVSHDPADTVNIVGNRN